MKSRHTWSLVAVMIAAAVFGRFARVSPPGDPTFPSMPYSARPASEPSSATPEDIDALRARGARLPNVYFKIPPVTVPTTKLPPGMGMVYGFVRSSSWGGGRPLVEGPGTHEDVEVWSVHKHQRGRLLNTVKSDDQALYQIVLPPGQYIIVVMCTTGVYEDGENPVNITAGSKIHSDVEARDILGG